MSDPLAPNYPPPWYLPPPVISERADELSQQISREVNPAPPPELVEAVKRYYAGQREELSRRVSEIEALLGFFDTGDNLAGRVAKLEAFTGVNKG